MKVWCYTVHNVYNPLMDKRRRVIVYYSGELDQREWCGGMVYLRSGICETTTVVIIIIIITSVASSNSSCSWSLTLIVWRRVVSAGRTCVAATVDDGGGGEEESSGAWRRRLSVNADCRRSFDSSGSSRRAAPNSGGWRRLLTRARPALLVYPVHVPLAAALNSNAGTCERVNPPTVRIKYTNRLTNEY